MPFIVFSGLPGSGKSTVARALAPRLHLPLLDKDDFLDALFEERGIGDRAWRSSLSREADVRFVAAALALSGACLVSWWQHPQLERVSGTPTEWLVQLGGPIIEVHCRCRIETAVDRFLSRSRHAGHLDSFRSRRSLRAQFASCSAAGPLACGTVVDLNTEQAVRIEALVRRVERAVLKEGASASIPARPNDPCT